MTEKQLARATARYNSIMWDAGYEFATVGETLSKNTEGWNLRDMVSEAQYVLDLWQSPDCIWYQDAHAGGCISDPDELRAAYKYWYGTIQRLKRFINAYKDEAVKMTCTSGHCSKFD